jgi:antitoxin (DNA-binding transcriptional repressor) of toxin-antitoxin stability system
MLLLRRAESSASDISGFELLSTSSYYRGMTTLSPTRARANLTSLLKRAANGEDVGILHGDKVIALRPVTVHSEDYALQEYGVTEKQLHRFVKQMNRQIARDRRAGRMKVFSGDIEKDIAD